MADTLMDARVSLTQQGVFPIARVSQQEEPVGDAPLDGNDSGESGGSCRPGTENPPSTSSGAGTIIVSPPTPLMSCLKSAFGRSIKSLD